MKKSLLLFCLALTFTMGSSWGNSLSAQMLYDNGSLVNRPGLGSGGADESMLQSTSLNMTTIGLGHQKSAGNRIADDFIIPNCVWNIDSIAFFAYQTGSPTTSTMTEVNLQVWNGAPGASGSAVIFGDTSTNRMIATGWSGIYRVTETTTGATNRPIMRNVVNTSGLSLGAGTYWLDWQTDGSLASGPWIPPITIDSVTTTGNGLQFTTTWAAAQDGGSLTPQGFKFVIYGSSPAPTVSAGQAQTTCPGVGVTLNPTVSGTAPLTYSWSPTTGLSSSTVANPTATPNVSTTYVLTVTDSGGCVGVDSVTVNIGTISSNILGGDTSICFGSGLTLDAGTGSGYNWSTGDTTQTITVSQSGIYWVDLYQASGCPLRDSIVVGLSVPVQILEDDTTICPNDLIGISATSTGFTGWQWSNGASTSSTQLGPGTHSVTGTDNGGCVSSDTIVIGALPGISSGFNFTAAGNGVDYTFNDASINATSWFWDFGDGNTSSVQNPSHTYATNGNYTVTLIASNQCESDTFFQSLVVVSWQEAELGSFNVYPNPARDQVSLDLSQATSQALEVRILDLRGRELKAFSFPAGTQKANLSLQGITEGVYLLQLSIGEERFQRKLRVE